MDLENDAVDFYIPPDANFRIIRGKQKSSKVYVKEPFTYIHDKSMSAADRIYLKCRIKTCQARATIENSKFLKLSSYRPHNCCESDDAAMTNITCLELASKMKMRAETESSSFFVSTLHNSKVPTFNSTLFQPHLSNNYLHTFSYTIKTHLFFLFQSSKSGEKK